MDLLKFLDQNENSRKIFGKRELKIIEKQLNGVELTQSEKNRLSRSIRKKLEFIERAANFSDEFKLKKGSRINRIIEETVKEILSDELRNKILKIYLYGSFVENKFTLFSDIDIAVDFKEINLKLATLFRQRIFGRVNEKVDIQVLNILPNKIKTEIFSKGKIIYESENKR
ncbi:nucleotidyltransferase domain-containing protein [Candidatus Woesearchaeota archaeon]|mgnify:CR=1 FL=1|jgi:predicted nucleotidyltransferase|nr:nucleotidyltransferase domain-containing protein [Candidatus Woesearchaeota archaeon]MBT6519942.1 nucleotidyltransferase domain-containing protein [Candidatus Woesearchaeota archaeon]MBT7367857.1 nucleotidyltransferase domain-containing protein [Candidatus Woesearchaeota archaeon]